MFIMKLTKLHNIATQSYNLSRRIVSTNSNQSLHLAHESILFLGKDSNQSLAFPLKEKGNNLSLLLPPRQRRQKILDACGMVNVHCLVGNPKRKI
jgi:hypothetical protein